MSQNSSKNIYPFIVELLIGIVGAIGQAYMLHHKLVDRYPYKVLDYPFYKDIADAGLFCAPLIAILGGAFGGLKRRSFAVIFPVVSCPLLFAIVFKIVAIYPINRDAVYPADWSFEGVTPAIAAQDFFSYTISLAIAGFIIGAFCNWLLSRLLKPKKLP